MARLQAAVLCNAASVEASGLVSILGAFVDTVNTTAETGPVRQQLWMVARLLFVDADIGVDHTVEVLVEPLELDEPVAQGGEIPPLVQISGVVRAERPPDADPRLLGGGPLVLPLALEFPGTGLYHVTLSLDGDLLWDAPLAVKRVARA